MIRTQLLEDFFLIWSFPPERAQGLAPAGLRPFLFEDRAWLSLSVARFKGVRFFGLPVARQALVAALLLLVEYQDREGKLRHGNYFLKAYTDNRFLAGFDRIFGFGVFHHKPVPRLGMEEGVTRFDLGDLLSFQLHPAGGLDPGKQQRMERLFQDNRSGVLSRGNRIFYSALEKEHWRMPGLGVHLQRTDLLGPFSARFEFAFNTSFGTCHWHRFRKVSLPPANP